MTGPFLFVFLLVEVGCLVLGLTNYRKIAKRANEAGASTAGFGVYRYAYGAMLGSRETWLMTGGFGLILTLAILFRVVLPLVGAYSALSH